MANLTDYRLLCFDVYGTLIDWETGVITALQPLLQQILPHQQPTRKQILDIFHELEKKQQAKTPDLPYSALLTTIHPQFAAHFQLEPPPISIESHIFGQSVGHWPAFPDTVDALTRLGKHYKLVVLSNVDRASFTQSNAGPLQNIKFDRIITAQDVGSYKPDLRNFEYMLQVIKDEFDVDKTQMLQTAQSQFHDHHPAAAVGIKSVWIERGGTMGNLTKEIFDWKFSTLGEMADAVDQEIEARKV